MWHALAPPLPLLALQVLKAFLTARQGYIMQCLAGATGAGAETDLDSLACILADVATMVRSPACPLCKGCLVGLLRMSGSLGKSRPRQAHVDCGCTAFFPHPSWHACRDWPLTCFI